MGIIAVLHTWDQTLNDHFHLHCLIPAGALSLDQNRWIKARPNFLFAVKALSVVFRGKFLDLLTQAGENGRIETPSEGIKALRKKHWIVYAKKPFGSPPHRAGLPRPLHPIASLCPMSASSQCKAVRSLSPTGTAKTKIG